MFPSLRPEQKKDGVAAGPSMKRGGRDRLPQAERGGIRTVPDGKGQAAAW